MPPLSWTLRDSPQRRERAAAGAYSFGERAEPISRLLLSRAPLRLRSFCLRVSGAVAPSAPRSGRDLSRGRANSAPCVTLSARCANSFRPAQAAATDEIVSNCSDRDAKHTRGGEQPIVVACELYRIVLRAKKLNSGQMERIQRANSEGKRI